MSSVIDWFLVWWLRIGRYKWSWLRRRLFERRYLTTALPVANSLEEIQLCLKEIEWAMDGPLHLFDCISYPQVTWSKKKDDCDGFSSLAAELLTRWKPTCKPVLVTALVRPVQASHTVCVFAAPEGGLWFFDNATLRNEGYATHEDVVLRISRPNHRLICWDVREPTSLDMVEFHRM